MLFKKSIAAQVQFYRERKFVSYGLKTVYGSIVSFLMVSNFIGIGPTSSSNNNKLNKLGIMVAMT